ncbi:hypothetical protein CAEBREN_21910 [Caenorhabditis brenneri]|uniref:Uncharacterized protein n=1 Tax=Caenorhabditis brenneri TaxID=135651 RepID=G0MG41_CAEBE|nr:hypothetical protein CAEBREN_21910 [Caenorhabditis brenneri]
MTAITVPEPRKGNVEYNKDEWKHTNAFLKFTCRFLLFVNFACLRFLGHIWAILLISFTTDPDTEERRVNLDFEDFCYRFTGIVLFLSPVMIIIIYEVEQRMIKYKKLPRYVDPAGERKEMEDLVKTWYSVSKFVPVLINVFKVMAFFLIASIFIVYCFPVKDLTLKDILLGPDYNATESIAAKQ